MAKDAGRNKWLRKTVFTTGEAAEVCQVSQQTIIRCFDNGRLGGFRVPGSKFRRIPRAELVKFMKANDIPLDALGGDTLRVLFVSGDRELREAAAEAFGDPERFDLEVCSSCYDAGLMTERFKPQVLILDAGLSDLDVRAVVTRLREAEETADGKVVVISASGVNNGDRGARSSGADAVMERPVDVGSLRELVTALTGE